MNFFLSFDIIYIENEKGREQMTRGNSYVLGLRNGEQIAKEVGSLLDVYDFEYNCGGFALGLPYWYLPYDNSDYDAQTFIVWAPFLSIGIRESPLTPNKPID